MKTLDLCIPAYNEAEVIVQSLKAIRETTDTIPDLMVRILVADNGSTDGTTELVRALQIPGVEVLSVEQRGKGAAIIHAAHHSDADFFGFIDADLSADPSGIIPLLEALHGGADIALGSRLLDEHTVTRSYLRTLSSKAFNLARTLMLGISVADTQCGLKLMNTHGRSLLRTCTESGWFLDLELLARAERAGHSLKELPVSWNEYRFPSRVSKLRVIRDGIGAVCAMVRVRRTLSRELV